MSNTLNPPPQVSPANNRSQGNIISIKVFPANGGAGVEIKNLVPEFSYYENILSNTLTARMVVTDSGGLDPDNKQDMPGILDGIPIRGGEAVEVIITDSFQTKLTFTGPKSLYVNRVSAGQPGTQKDVLIIDLCTRDYFANEQVRIKKCFQGKISDSVYEIIKDAKTGLGSPKPIEIDETVEPYRFIGNLWKPFKVCTWLASRSNPSNKPPGHAAGYFFYEDYDGFKFKSIDALVSREPSLKCQYTNLPQKKEGYEPIQVYSINRNIDVHQNLVLGTYNNKSIFWNSFDCQYIRVDYDIKQQKPNLDTAGKNFVGDFVNEKFTEIPTRLMTRILDNGYQPLGNSAEEQLQQWKSKPKKPMYEAPNLMAQTLMRYNQLYSIKTHITIRGNMKLRAGHTILCEFPDLKDARSRKPNATTTGKYIIASLCHRITRSETLTSLTLVRDSFTK
jgi:hypothetical protein